MGIDSLPLEILTSILRCVKYVHGREMLSSCMLVSRQWRVIAFPLIWESVILNTRTLPLFITEMNNAPRIGGHIRSLTLRLHTLWATTEEFRAGYAREVEWIDGIAPRTRKLWEDLKKLADCIAADMTNLTSFSLFVHKLPPEGRTDRHHNDPRGAGMSSVVLRQLLETLPPTCIDLELDTKGREDDETCGFDPQYHDSAHLCPILQSLLPRLRHLRLRLGFLCPELLFLNQQDGGNVMNAPRLRTLLINLSLSPFGLGGQHCRHILSSPAAAQRFNDQENIGDDDNRAAEVGMNGPETRAEEDKAVAEASGAAQEDVTQLEDRVSFQMSRETDPSDVPAPVPALVSSESRQTQIEDASSLPKEDNTIEDFEQALAEGFYRDSDLSTSSEAESSLLFDSGSNVVQSIDGDDVLLPVNHYMGIELQTSFLKVLQKAYQEGAFPNAASVQLMNLLGSADMQYSHWVQYDIHDRTCYSLPFRLMDPMRHQEGQEYFARTRNDEELFGAWGATYDLEERIEEAPWVTTVDGCRWSKDFFGVGYRQMTAIKDLRFETRDEYTSRRRDDMPTDSIMVSRYLANLKATEDAHTTIESMEDDDEED
ncbi:MAG: hypothetical protein Q9220_003635 [cf. Caloplaca sp. 1 TL-2023]